MANQFLIKDTMELMKTLDSTEIDALKSGIYAGVQLLGYYEKWDTPAPIIYHCVNMLIDPDPGPEDGGSVIIVNSIKLVHNFIGSNIDLRYFGLNTTESINGILMKSLAISSKYNTYTVIPPGKYYIDKGFIPPLNAKIKGHGKHCSTICLNPLTANNDNDPFKEHYVINVHNGNFELIDIELDANSENIMASRSSGINLTNNVSNILIERIRIKNAKTILPVFSGGYGITSWGNAVNVTINDVEFENIGQSDLGIFEGKDWYVTNIKSSNCGYIVINIESSSGSSSIENIIVDGVFATNVGHSVVSMIKNDQTTGYVEGCVVRNVFVDKCSVKNSNIGSLRVRATKNCKIENVNINESFGSGIVISGDQGFPTENLIINNVVINKITTTNAGYGLLISAISANVRHNQITLSNISLPECYMAGFLADKVDGLSVDNIVIKGAKTSRGFQSQNCTDVNVSNLEVKSAYSYAVVLHSVVGANISNVRAFNCSTAGFLLSGSSDNIIIGTSTVSDNREVMVLINAITIESSLLSKTPQIIIANNNLQNVVSSNKIAYQTGVIKKRIRIINNLGIDDSASLISTGLVNQTSPIQNINELDLSNTTASDVAGLSTWINTNLIPLVNAIKASQNDELNNQRTAGQQAV